MPHRGLHYAEREGGKNMVEYRNIELRRCFSEFETDSDLEVKVKIDNMPADKENLIVEELERFYDKVRKILS